MKDAAQKLTGPKNRAFMAKVAEDYFGGSARQAESHLGWKRQSVQLGLLGFAPDNVLDLT